jgi:hypothetical protein
MKLLKPTLLIAGALAVALFMYLRPWGSTGPSTIRGPVDAEGLAALEDDFTFLIAADLGRNGYYHQKPVAEMMGEVAEVVDPEFVAALGDVHHFKGVRSIDDPLWLTNFEWVYSHPELSRRPDRLPALQGPFAPAESSWDESMNPAHAGRPLLLSQPHEPPAAADPDVGRPDAALIGESTTVC